MFPMFTRHRQSLPTPLSIKQARTELALSEVERECGATPMYPARRYEYRRRLPHFQKADTPIFATFRKLTRDPFSAEAHDVVLKHCLYEHGKRIELYAAVVMPDHVHLLFKPLRDADGWPHPLHKIMKLIKGTSARDINKLIGTNGPVWQDESFDHVLRSEESLQGKTEYIGMNPVRRGLVQTPEQYKWLWLHRK